jgi:hypothetical protein
LGNLKKVAFGKAVNNGRLAVDEEISLPGQIADVNAVDGSDDEGVSRGHAARQELQIAPLALADHHTEAVEQERLLAGELARRDQGRYTGGNGLLCIESWHDRRSSTPLDQKKLALPSSWAQDEGSGRNKSSGERIVMLGNGGKPFPDAMRTPAAMNRHANTPRERSEHGILA